MYKLVLFFWQLALPRAAQVNSLDDAIKQALAERGRRSKRKMSAFSRLAVSGRRI